MTRHRRLLLVLVALLGMLALTVAACGGDGASSGDGSQAEAATTGGESDADDSASSEPVTLEVWNHWAGGNNEPWRKAIAELDAEFMKKHPNITIKQVYQSFEGLEAKFKAAVASGDVPDVTMTFGSIDWKALRPLDDLITDEQREELILIETQRSPIDQKIRFIPYGAYGEVFFMNRAVWEKAGLDPDNPPTQWADFMETCETFRQQGIDMPIAYAFKDPWTAIRVFAWIGGQLFTVEELLNEWNQAKIDWGDERPQAALDRFLEMAKEHACFGEKPETRLSTDVYNEFLAGRAPLTLAAQAYGFPLSEVEAKIGKGNLDFMAMPLIPNAVYDEPTIDGGNNNLFSITCASEHPEAAWKYISFYLDEHGQEVMFQRANQYPNNMNADVSVAQTPLDGELAKQLLNPDLHYGTWQASPREADVFNRNAPLFLAGRMGREQFVSEMREAREEARADKERDLRRADAAC